MRARIAVAFAVLVAATSSSAAPTNDLQNLTWFVVQGIGQGENLAFYQGVIDTGLVEAQLLLQGNQGPADVPCCTDIRRAAITQVALSTLQDVDSATDYDDMDDICNQQGGGSCAFLVDSITFCGGFSPGTIGCADTPSCASNVPDDNPTLTLVVSLDALAGGAFAQTLVHERGHNACLTHVAANPCQVMQSATGGGCLSAAECGHYRDAGNATGGACQCHTDALATAADGSACSEVASGLCSGGVCGAAGSDASVVLLAAGGPESVEGAATDDPLRISGLSGGWTDLGSFSGATQILGLEYAPGRDRVYGVTSADALVTIDPVTGAQLATIGTLPATGDFFVPPDVVPLSVRYDGLAFDPGATASPADDQLYLVRQPESCDDSDFCFSQIVSVDPDTAATTFVGDLDTGFFDGFQGLAFDGLRGRLYASAGGSVGIWEIDLACPFEFCSVIDVAGEPRIESSLAYDAATDRLYLVGTQSGGRLFYDSFDAETFEHDEAIGIDGFTPGGLAAPEPSAFATGITVLVALTWLRRGTPQPPRRAARRDC
jgi:hypothetical protein